MIIRGISRSTPCRADLIAFGKLFLANPDLVEWLRENAPLNVSKACLALRKAFAGAYIANNDYTRDLAIDAVQQNRADLIAFGKLCWRTPILSNGFARMRR